MVSDGNLKAQCLAFKGSVRMKPKLKKILVFSLIKSLKVNNSCFHCLIISVYIHIKGSACVEAAILCHHMQYAVCY